ncbi:MAG: RNA polymerase sigma factor [Anaerolineales bacterium]
MKQRNSHDTVTKEAEGVSLACRAARDPAAFVDFFERWHGPVYNYARYRCEDDATADELAAQVFERLLTCIEQYDPARGAFAPWLFTIARNVVNDHYRKQRHGRWLPLDFFRKTPAPEPDPEAYLIACETEQELLAALENAEACNPFRLTFSSLPLLCPGRRMENGWPRPRRVWRTTPATSPSYTRQAAKSAAWTRRRGKCTTRSVGCARASYWS